jgi:hypothetical protein
LARVVPAVLGPLVVLVSLMRRDMEKEVIRVVVVVMLEVVVKKGTGSRTLLLETTIEILLKVIKVRRQRKEWKLSREMILN